MEFPLDHMNASNTYTKPFSPYCRNLVLRAKVHSWLGEDKHAGSTTCEKGGTRARTHCPKSLSFSVKRLTLTAIGLLRPILEKDRRALIIIVNNFGRTHEVFLEDPEEELMGAPVEGKEDVP